MNRLLSCFAIVAAALAGSPAHSYQAYLVCQSHKSGSVAPKSPRSRHGWVPCLSFSYGVIAPRDQQSGLASGKRKHKPFVVSIEEVDAEPFRAALQNEKNIDEIAVQVIRPAGPGMIEHYETIKLTNATVSSIRAQNSKTPSGGKKHKREYLLVDFTYQKIEITEVNPTKADVDDWTK